MGDLKIDDSPNPKSFPIDVFTMEDLRVLRVELLHDPLIEGFLRPFYSNSGEGIPCRSLQEIECTSQEFLGQSAQLLIDLARERKRTGHQLQLVILLIVELIGRHLVKELRENVGKVQIVE